MCIYTCMYDDTVNNRWKFLQHSVLAMDPWSSVKRNHPTTVGPFANLVDIGATRFRTLHEQWDLNPCWLMNSWGMTSYPSYVGDYSDPRTGTPVLNQPGSNGMIQGFWTLLACLCLLGALLARIPPTDGLSIHTSTMENGPEPHELVSKNMDISIAMWIYQRVEQILQFSPA